jgi:hypothetical protein
MVGRFCDRRNTNQDPAATPKTAASSRITIEIKRIPLRSGFPEAGCSFFCVPKNMSEVFFCIG